MGTELAVSFLDGLGILFLPLATQSPESFSKSLSCSPYVLSQILDPQTNDNDTIQANNEKN